MHRRIVGFHQDDEGDWVADLSCRHRQHVRHRPPFFDRAWVQSPEGRATRLGTDLDCPLCDRGEAPDSLHLEESFTSLHLDELVTHLADGDRYDRWARLRVEEGVARLELATTPPAEVELREGQERWLPPGISLQMSGEALLFGLEIFVGDDAPLAAPEGP